MTRLLAQLDDHSPARDAAQVERARADALHRAGLTRVVVYSTETGGHHPEYDAVIARELAAIGVEVVFTNKLAVALAARRVLFPMIEANRRAFLLCVLASCATARRVSGLLFRPGECFRAGLKYRLKRLAFRAFGVAPRTKVLSIVPFSVAPQFAQVAWDWVHDPQMWDCPDLGDRDDEGDTPLAAELIAHARGRPIVVALGQQNRIKGFAYFCEVWSACPELRERRLFVAAGRIAPECRVAADRLASLGGVVVDRHLSFEEMASLYRAAGMVWAVYHPTYDQASGIAGRAFQSGAPVALRRGSLMASLLRELAHPIVEVDYDAPQKAARRTLTYDAATPRSVPSREATAAMRRRFIETIALSLNVVADESDRRRA